jgi:hypothetical protein
LLHFAKSKRVPAQSLRLEALGRSAASSGARCFAIFFTFKKMACLIAGAGKAWDRSVLSLKSFSPVAKLKRVT